MKRRIYIIEYKLFKIKSGLSCKLIPFEENNFEWKREIFDYEERQEFIDRFIKLKKDNYSLYGDIKCFCIDYGKFEIKDMKSVINAI